MIEPDYNLQNSIYTLQMPEHCFHLSSDPGNSPGGRLPYRLAMRFCAHFDVHHHRRNKVFEETDVFDSQTARLKMIWVI